MLEETCCLVQWGCCAVSQECEMEQSSMRGCTAYPNISVDQMWHLVLNVHRSVALLDDDCGKEEENEVPSLKRSQCARYL